MYDVEELNKNQYLYKAFTIWYHCIFSIAQCTWICSN